MNGKRLVPILFCLVALALFWVPSCKSNEAINPDAVGILKLYEGCKPTGKSMSEYEIGAFSNEDCIEYHYNGQKLTLKHINGAFNCCPGKITADIEIDGNMITISEKEKEAGCFCLCLFDLEYEISNIESGEYTIFINQLYLEDNDQVLEFTLQLFPGTSGTFCLPRNHYPWGE